MPLFLLRFSSTSVAARPILVMTFAKVWFRDLYNFPKRSLHDPTTPEPAGGDALSPEYVPVPAPLPAPQQQPQQPLQQPLQQQLQPSPQQPLQQPPPQPPSLPPLQARPLPLVSVVIPTRGTKVASLARAVASVWAQEGAAAATAAATDDPEGARPSGGLVSPVTFRLEVVVAVDGPDAPRLPGEGPAVEGLAVEGPTEGAGEGDGCGCASCGGACTPGACPPHLGALADPRLRVVRLREASGGRPGLVRNAGVAASRAGKGGAGGCADGNANSADGDANDADNGDWVAFLDDDDAWLPGKLAAQLGAVARFEPTPAPVSVPGRAAAPTAARIVLVCGGCIEDHALVEHNAVAAAAEPTAAASVSAAAATASPPRPTMPRGWEALPELLGREHLPRPQSDTGGGGSSGGGSSDGDPGSLGRSGAAAAAHVAALGNPLVCSTVLVRPRALAAAGGFGPEKYGQDLSCWRRCLESGAQPPKGPQRAEDDGRSHSGPHRPHRPHHHRGAAAGPAVALFVGSCLAVYGTGGLERSTVAMATRQAVRAAVDQAAVALSSNGVSACAPMAAAPGAAASLIHGFLGI